MTNPTPKVGAQVRVTEGTHEGRLGRVTAIPDQRTIDEIRRDEPPMPSWHVKLEGETTAHPGFGPWNIEPVAS